MEKNFGKHVRDLRKASGLTLVELAKKTGLSQPYLSQIENGKRGIPDPEIIKKIADCLTADYFDLMGSAGYWGTEEAVFRKNLFVDSNKNLDNLNKTLPESKITLNDVLSIDGLTFNNKVIRDKEKELIKLYLEALLDK